MYRPGLRWVLLLSIAIGLSACATGAQKEFKRIDAQMNSTFKASQACWTQAQNGPDASRLADKVVFNPQKFDYRLLTINEKIGNKDKEYFLNYRNAAQKCRNLGIEGFSKAHFEFSNQLIKTYTIMDKQILELLRGDITLGEFNSQYVESANKFNRELNLLGAKVSKSLKSAHQSEVAIRQKQIGALQAWHNEQMRIQREVDRQNMEALSRAASGFNETNCTVYGNNINCHHN